MNIEVSPAAVVDAELVAAFDRLIPQLSESNPPPTADALQSIVDNPDSFLFVARHPARPEQGRAGYMVVSPPPAPSPRRSTRRTPLPGSTRRYE